MTIEVTAKKVDEAINQGLAQLGVTLDEVNVEVIESGGLFRKAKVRLTVDKDEQPSAPVKPEPAKKPTSDNSEKTPVKKSEKTEKTDAPAVKQKPQAQPELQKPKADQKPTESKPTVKSDAAKKQPEKSESDTAEPRQAKPKKLNAEEQTAVSHALGFVKDVVQRMGFESAEVTAQGNGELLNIAAADGDDSLIIGRHGETLSALSYLAETIARAEKCHVNITVDCNGYRDRRAATLTAMAKRRANECASKRRKIRLEPMERVDRRTVHNALTGDDRVTTASEGKEPRRYVVIIPNK